MMVWLTSYRPVAVTDRYWSVDGGFSPGRSTCSTGAGSALSLARMIALFALVEVSRCHCH